MSVSKLQCTFSAIEISGLATPSFENPFAEFAPFAALQDVINGWEASFLDERGGTGTTHFGGVSWETSEALSKLQRGESKGPLDAEGRKREEEGKRPGEGDGCI